MKYIVFSPYWVVPKSIYRKEIAPAMVKNPNYMEEHDMEWHDGDVRQRPGPKNPLGLIKFLFPNSNSIYLHDTPSKSLFDKEKRAFSHGCIRIEKPRELANLILKYDKKWTPEKIDEAMNSGVEKTVHLKHSIPVIITYYTAWVDENSKMNFREDIYGFDQNCAVKMFSNVQ